MDFRAVSESLFGQNTCLMVLLHKYKNKLINRTITSSVGLFFTHELLKRTSFVILKVQCAQSLIMDLQKLNTSHTDTLLIVHNNLSTPTAGFLIGLLISHSCGYRCICSRVRKCCSIVTFPVGSKPISGSTSDCESSITTACSLVLKA